MPTNPSPRNRKLNGNASVRTIARRPLAPVPSSRTTRTPNSAIPAVDVDPVQHPVDVDLIQCGVQIDLVQQFIHIQRGNHKIYSALDSGLGPTPLGAGPAGPPPNAVAQTSPRGKYRCSMRAWTSPFRVSRQIRRVSPDW